jgi:hypothetical protein
MPKQNKKVVNLARRLRTAFSREHRLNGYTVIYISNPPLKWEGLPDHARNAWIKVAKEALR